MIHSVEGVFYFGEFIRCSSESWWGWCNGCGASRVPGVVRSILAGRYVFDGRSAFDLISYCTVIFEQDK